MNDPHGIVLETLPSIPFTQLRRLPDCPAIYFAVSQEGVVLYIGQTQSLILRWMQHNRRKQLADHGCALIAWHSCSIEQLHELESQLIKQFQPLLNDVQDLTALHTRIGIYIDRHIWHDFRVACVDRGLSSSKMIEQFIQEQLAAWQQQPQKETDHA